MIRGLSEIRPSVSIGWPRQQCYNLGGRAGPVLIVGTSADGIENLLVAACKFIDYCHHDATMVMIAFRMANRAIRSEHLACPFSSQHC